MMSWRRSLPCLKQQLRSPASCTVSLQSCMLTSMLSQRSNGRSLPRPRKIQNRACWIPEGDGFRPATSAAFDAEKDDLSVVETSQAQAVASKWGPSGPCADELEDWLKHSRYSSRRRVERSIHCFRRVHLLVCRR